MEVSLHVGEEVELRGGRFAVASATKRMVILRAVPGTHFRRDEGARADLFIPVTGDGTVHVRHAAATGEKAEENWRRERGDLETMTVRRWVALMK